MEPEFLTNASGTVDARDSIAMTRMVCLRDQKIRH
jgi:hypothetical protein